MRIRLLLNSEIGKAFMSILLGVGLATFFREVCKDKNCIRFKGPILSDIDGKVYKHGDKCYRYETQSSSTCGAEPNRKTVDVSLDRDKADTESMKEMFLSGFRQ
jgi:hypothetical protein